MKAQAVPFALRLVDADALGERLRTRILIEDQIEAARRGAADRGLAARGHPKRRMRPLRRRRLDDDVFKMPEAAAMGKTPARRPCAGHHLDRLFEPRLGLFRRDLEALEFAVPVALANAEVEA